VGGLGNLGSFFIGSVPFYFSQGTASPDNVPQAFTIPNNFGSLGQASSTGQSSP
jgi:hypothetical protein